MWDASSRPVGDQFGGDEQAALVLPVGVVDDHHHAAVGQRGHRVLHRLGGARPARSHDVTSSSAEWVPKARAWKVSGLPSRVRAATTRPRAITWSPPPTRSASSHASQPGVRGRRGRPWSSSPRTPWNLPAPPFLAKASASADWAEPSTFTPNRRDSRTSASSSDALSRATSTIGGSIDRDAKALTVVPCGSPPAIAVTTDTGVATPAITSRK